MQLTTRGGLFAALAVLVVAAGAFFLTQPADVPQATIVRYGVTPFQDSALPVVAQTKGWYARENLDVELVDLGWPDVQLALASGAIDVAIYNFDSFMSSWHPLQGADKTVVFYAPLYTWNGAAIMVRREDGYETVPELAGSSNAPVDDLIPGVMEQMRGKRIGVTEGTTFEQTVLDALAAAGMSRDDVSLINARPEDNLAAFLAGDLDAFSAGLTERVQANRNGATELIIGPDVSVPVVDGLIASEQFVNENPDVIEKLVDLWFETVAYVGSDPAVNSTEVRDYLRTRASVDYTPEEYAVAWTFQYFPMNEYAAYESFMSENSRYFWRPIWDSNNRFLLDQEKIPSLVPYEAFLGRLASRGN